MARVVLAAGQKGELTWEILSTAINPSVLVPSFSQQYAKLKVDLKVNEHVGLSFAQQFERSRGKMETIHHEELVWDKAVISGHVRW